MPGTLAGQLPLQWEADFICANGILSRAYPGLGLRLGRDENRSVTILILCLLFCFLPPPPPLYPIPVLNKGQCVTKYYRWMQKNGGYIWIQSSATIAINAKNANEKNIIWVNYLLRYLSCFVSLSVINWLTAETSWVPSFLGTWAVCSFFPQNSKKQEKIEAQEILGCQSLGSSRETGILSWSTSHPEKMPAAAV